MLVENFIAALAAGRGVAANMHLALLIDAVKVVEQESLANSALAYYTDKLETMLAKPDFALNPLLTNEFAQLLGEAHFLTLCREKGITLARIPEQAAKTPDFETSNVSPQLHFEVKTLSVVDGEDGIEATLKSAANANVRLQTQIDNGATIAMTEHTVAPYGDKTYTEDGPVSAIIHTLIKKTRNNIKFGQFTRPNTFLVLNLSMIPASGTKREVLRPYYPDDHPYPMCLSGDLWMLAFGQPGMLIQGRPEFEGKPGIEGVMKKSGILNGSSHSFIAGILLMIHPWGKPAQIWGLVRASEKESWDDHAAGVSEAFHKLVGDNWNDSDDTNGWALATGEGT